MSSEYTIEKAGYDEILEGMALARAVFASDIAPSCNPDGAKAFENRIAEGSASEQKYLSDETFMYVATDSKDEHVIGMLAMSVGFIHINLLFVEHELQRLGIGTALLDFMIEDVEYSAASVSKISVNAFPDSVEFYAKYGFSVTGDAEENEGLVTIPMTIEI